MSFPVRFRMVPPFGTDTIRPITYDVSDFHQLAARDYEDLLQVSGTQSADAIVTDLIFQ
jgi:hypothetical protein